MLAKMSVKKPYTVVVAVILVLILGVVSFMNLSTDLLPPMELPYVVIMTQYVGASPERVETLVTEPLEQTMATTNDIQNIQSVSQENLSLIMLEFSQDANLDSAIIDMSNKIDLLRGQWPDEVGSPTMLRINPDMMPVMVASIDRAGMDHQQLSTFVQQEVLPELESTSGVASVTAMGLVSETVQVQLSQEKLDALNQKIERSVQGDLNKASNALYSAKRQIEDGKAQLAQQREERGQQLSQGLAAVEDGAAQVDAALSSIQQAETAYASTQQQYDALVLQEADLTAQRNALMAIDEADRTPEQEQSIQRLSGQLAQLAAQKPVLSQQLQAFEAQVEQLQPQKQQLTEQQQSLAVQRENLLAAQSTLNAELEKAEAQLLSGESELNAQLQKLNSAQSQALAQASLDGVITRSMVEGLLAAQNFSMPAGYIQEGDASYLLKVGDAFASLEEIQSLTLFELGLAGIEEVKLSDVADVQMANNAGELYAKVNGNDGVLVTIQKQSTASTADVSDALAETIAQLGGAYEGLRITPLMDQGMYIDMVVDNVLQNLLYGGILAIVILFLFLKDVKPTLIIAISIPFSVVFAVALMYFTGVTINVISLAGLALGVGMLVDNSIVVIENIFRLRSEGVPPVRAAIRGAQQVSGAIIASTLTTVCVFLPIVFTQGLSRQLFADMGLTIAYSLLASLIVALTLVPMMASTTLRHTQEKRNRLFERIVRWYERALSFTLSHRAAVLLFAVALLGFSAFEATRMGMRFIPEMDGTQMSMTVTAAPDATEAQTRALSDQVIARLVEIPEIETVGAMQQSGSMLGTGSGGNTVSMYLVLKSDKERTAQQVAQDIRDRTADLAAQNGAEIAVNASQMDMSMLGGSGIELWVKGRDLDTLRATAQDVAAILADTPGTTEVDDGLGDPTTETRITVDKNKAMAYSLTVAQVYQQIAQQIATEQSATTLTVGTTDYDVVVSDFADNGVQLSSLSDLELEGQRDGETVAVKLSDIATVTQAQGFSSILHDDQTRFVQVSAQIDADHNVTLVSREVSQRLAEYDLPAGCTVEIQGESEMIASSMSDLLLMIALAVVFIYLIMVAQFQSLLSPFIVMFTIPLAFTGGLLALWLTGQELSLIAMLGFLVLAGVVVNNGIVFVDYVNQLREAGMAKRDALIAAGKTRLRPILMTAMTTILGLVTLALGVGGAGAQMLQSLGIVTIGGLTYATLLTLLVVPVMYDLLHRKPLKIVRIEEEDEEVVPV